MEMYKLNKQQAETINSTQIGNSSGFARETVFGFFVCSLNSAKEFPDLFDWDKIDTIFVDETFFPITEE